MAIVKFVSDKNCLIFIDKECIGEVNKDSILKHSLEPGGYLVEIKDKGKRILNKYCLEINLTDNQVLQDVSEETNVIEYNETSALDDDTTLYEEIVYRGAKNIVKKDGKYGIVDPDNKIILQIEYREIAMLGDRFFKVKIDNGWSLGFLYHGTIYSGTYDNISLYSENGQFNTFIDVFSVKVGNKYGCINSEGKILIPIEYDKIELNSSFYNPRNFSFLLYRNKKVGYCDVSYFHSDYFVSERTLSYNFEYVNYVKPIYDECKLLRNKKSVLNGFYMHYAAIQKDGKWGILDQRPRMYTYYAIDANLESDDEQNLTDLDFKYNSLEELENDADNEFQRRYEKYYQPWDLNKDENGNYRVVKRDTIEISSIETEEEDLRFLDSYTEEDLLKAWTDEYGVKYTPDRKKLIDASTNCKEYQVVYGTEVLCYLSFGHNSSIEKVKIPDTVKYIAKEAFFLSKIKRVNIPDSVKGIGSQAFFESEISFISLSSKMSIIASMTFSGCQKLYQIVIPSNIKKIDEFAFERCEFLRDVQLNEGLKSIGKGAFYNCYRLSKLTIPPSVSEIGVNPFLGCMCDIKCLSPHFIIKNGMLFSSDMKRLISCLHNNGEIDIPKRVEIIGGSSFNSGVTSISIPNTVKLIGMDAFSNTSIKTITIPKSVQKIERYALRNCKNIEEIRILNKNIVIEEGFIDNCESLKVILIPKGTYSYFFDLFGEWWIRDILVEGTRRSIFSPKDATYISEQLHKNTMFRHPNLEKT